MNKISYDVIIKIDCGYGKSPITWIALDDSYERSMRICGNLCTYHDDYSTLTAIMDDIVNNPGAQIESANDELLEAIENEVGNYDYDDEEIKLVLNKVHEHREAWK